MTAIPPPRNIDTSDDELRRIAGDEYTAFDATHQALATELLAARDRAEKHRIRLVAAESDLLDVRGVLSPNGYPRRIPAEVDISGSIVPAVEWLLARITELETVRTAVEPDETRESLPIEQLRALYVTPGAHQLSAEQIAAVATELMERRITDRNHAPVVKTLVRQRDEARARIIELEAQPVAPDCNGMCLTGSDVGVPSADIAYAHPDCPAHGAGAR